MELHQLAYFVAVVEESNFTRAAARVHVAQPGVSQQIRRLERELGEILLDRSGRAVRPTEAGRALLPYARAALTAVASGERAIEELRGLLRGHIALGLMAWLSDLDIPGLLAEFHGTYPGVEISVSEDHSASILAAVRGGELGAGIIGLSGRAPAGISSEVVASQSLVVVVAASDPLAQRNSVPLTVIKDRSLISLPRGSGLRNIVETACARVGFVPRVAIEVSELRLLAELAAQGLGLAILPRSVAAAYAGSARVLTVSQPRLQGRVVLIWKTEGPQSPAARAFLSLARRRLVAPPA